VPPVRRGLSGGDGGMSHGAAPGSIPT
jgi:hypothetical protein